MVEEERRISPAVVIIPVALGLGLLGVLAAYAWAAPAPPVFTCPHCGATFATQEELNYHIQNMHPEVPPEHGLKGDLDNDGTVQMQDLSMLYDLVSGYITIEWVAENAPIPMTVEEAFWRADVNDDGVINSLDITALERLLPVANLYGVVTDAETGYPLSGVKVSIDGLVSYTDASGNYGFTGLTPGSYTITFEKDGYETIVR